MFYNYYKTISSDLSTIFLFEIKYYNKYYYTSVWLIVHGYGIRTFRKKKTIIRTKKTNILADNSIYQIYSCSLSIILSFCYIVWKLHALVFQFNR